MKILVFKAIGISTPGGMVKTKNEFCVLFVYEICDLKLRIQGFCYGKYQVSLSESQI